MGFIYSISIYEISHQSFGPSHWKFPMFSANTVIPDHHFYALCNYFRSQEECSVDFNSCFFTWFCHRLTGHLKLHLHWHGTLHPRLAFILNVGYRVCWRWCSQLKSSWIVTAASDNVENWQLDTTGNIAIEANATKPFRRWWECFS